MCVSFARQCERHTVSQVFFSECGGDEGPAGVGASALLKRVCALCDETDLLTGENHHVRSRERG